MGRLLVIGTGLIGGSFALAARRAGFFTEVAGFDHDQRAARQAQRDGIIDSIPRSIASGVSGADAILVSVPTGGIATTVADVVASQHSAKPVFDVGSVKAPILAQLRARGAIPAQFVPCHPMAGSEVQGAGGAREDLFSDRRVFITPHEHSDPEVLERVATLWRACGASVTLADAESHDRAVALTSHLPHLVAFAFMAHAGPRIDEVAQFAGPGFRDFTRISGSDAHVWRHILIDNRAAVSEELDGFMDRLEQFKLLLDGDPAALEDALAAGRQARERFLRADD
ncbi:MAG: prephenate dehydrogenase [Gammaproteobacteria bacterium]|nr:prephenate dehydrogenase [Gammaproteobacteria bacterium]